VGSSCPSRLPQSLEVRGVLDDLADLLQSRCDFGRTREGRSGCHVAKFLAEAVPIPIVPGNETLVMR
jgi:hypothetical protein